ncbi:MAG: NADH-quinone oxidoreductase subunit NuoH [Ignavibacteria bacterium]|nr:NADH-quinone oxidoreductase subunit NuoH [Ignavibacteria bacterium]
MSQLLPIIIEFSIKALIILTMVMLIAAAFGVYLERKVSAWIQNRIGPNRVGPFGLLQPFADVIKLFLKEDIIPFAADKFFHRIAPIISLGVAFSVYAVIPFAEPFYFGNQKIYFSITSPDVNIGILFILAMTSIGVYGITFAGWSSNNKYSLLGGLRSSAQMISYELSMGVSVVGVIIIAGSLSLQEIVEKQANWNWNILYQPLGFIIFLVSAFAETNRSPFDLPETETELVGGYNTEYSGMKFGMFFLAEYANMFTSSMLIVLLYFGGWNLPFSLEFLGLKSGTFWLSFAQFCVLLAKTMIFVFIFIWVRWSIPRFRYDQLMYLGWKVLLPLGLLNLIITSFVVYFLKP